MSKEEKKSLEIISQFRADIDNIENSKKRQWTLMYYAFLFYALIFYITESGMTEDDSIFISLIIANFFNVVFCLYFLISTKKLLFEYRLRMSVISKTFSKTMKKIVPPEEICIKGVNDILLPLVFSFVIVIGWFVVSAVLFKKVIDSERTRLILLYFFLGSISVIDMIILICMHSCHNKQCKDELNV